MRYLSLLLLVSTTASAAPPTLTSLYPSGGQRGKTIEVVAAGAHDPWPVNAWSSHPGIQVKPVKDKGRFSVAIAADVPMGTHWLRLFNADGASEQRPFIVGSLPEVTEVEPNDDPKKPQILPTGNLVANGRLNPSGDVDHFAVELKKGQTFVASLEANSVLRSPMDAIMQILSADGFVLAENHDVHGLDPQIVFNVPRDGRYVVRVYAFPSMPDTGIRFSGGESYVYRLTLTTGAFADHAFPLAVSLKQPGAVEMRGWNIPESAKKISVRPDRVAEVWTVQHSDVANPVAIRVEPHRCIVEAEPNDRSRPQKIEAPATVSGHIEPARDIDVFEFAAKKGQSLTIQVEARTIGSALDPVVRFTDQAGKALNEFNDTTGNADPKFNVGIPADGNYRVEIHDLQYHGGERYYYRLRIFTPAPDYSISVAADQFTLAETLEIPITIDRVAGFAQPIEVKAVDLPSGVTASPVKADAKEKTAKLKLSAKNGANSGAFRIVAGVAGIADSQRTARANLAAFGTYTESLFVTVKPTKNPKK